MQSQAEINQKNAEFWNELCGTGLAKCLGITDHSPESLRRFDEAYFALYPYFLPFINAARMAGKDVLEIGLGYGSLGQQLAQHCRSYTGLDIAANAVRMTNLRMEIQGLPGRATVGSAHEMPFPDESFDFVVSIGCFHHTGNVQRCFDETFRVLRPGGTAILMVYNKFSFRQWRGWPFQTLKELLREWGLLAGKATLTEEQKYYYDSNGAGSAAPETVLLSKNDVRAMLGQFEQVAVQKQNADPLIVFGKVLIDRMKLLSNLGRVLGLDLYIEAKKATNSPGTKPNPIPNVPLAKAG